MRKLLAVLFFLLFASPVQANFQTAKTDYVYQYNLYRQAIDNYQVAKSTYLTYRTLTAQNDAENKLRLAIQTRDSVISSYYDLLQERLNIVPGISPSYRATFNIIKENEKDWLTEHQKKIDAAASLEDLNATAAEFEAHYPQFDRETKQAIGTILLTKEDNLKRETDQAIETLMVKLTQMRQSGEDTSFWDRGLINTKNKLDLYDQKYTFAKNIYFPENNGQIDIYSGQQRLTEANQYLREAVRFLQEIIKTITG